MPSFQYRTEGLLSGATRSNAAADTADRAAGVLSSVVPVASMFGDVRGSTDLLGVLGAAHAEQVVALRQSGQALREAAGRAAAVAGLSEMTTAATAAAARGG